jgi:ATP-dependent exoDNAse (exonuclease V) beta subunit
VDEYQDINPVQEAFLEALKAPRRILVGDPKQAIYGFRGGVPELLRKKLQSASERGEAYRLSFNHRSCAAVVELANTFVRDVVPRLDPAVADPGGEQAHHGEHSSGLRVTMAAIPSSKKQGGDLPAAASWIACLAQEMGWRAAGFEAQRESDSASSPQTNRRRALLLSRRTGLPALRRALQAAHIEPLVQSRDGFWESPGVRLMMALLETVARPEARVPLFAVLRSPWVGATDRELLTYALEEQTEVPSTIVEGLSWISALRTMSTQALLATAIARPGLLEFLASIKVHGALEPIRARRNLDHFLGWIPALPAVPSLAWSFLKQRRDAKDPGDAPAEDTAADLIVQTIHGAKGLEYDDVILPMLADRVKGVRKGTVRHRPGRPGELWIGWKLGQASGPVLRELKYEEERRTFREGLNLLYVGLTRAKDRMALLQQWPTDQEGHADEPSPASSRQKEGKLVCWNHVATELSNTHKDLQHLGDPPSLPKRETRRASVHPLPPVKIPIPLLPAAPPEDASSPERVHKGIQIHALIREVLVRQAQDASQARTYLSAHPLLRHWPEAKGMVERLLEELETRGWLSLPRRTELELECAGHGGGTGRADLVIWSPDRKRPEKIMVVDFKLSASFSDEILALHQEQVGAYVAALSALYHLALVEAWVVGLEGSIWIQMSAR